MKHMKAYIFTFVLVLLTSLIVHIPAAWVYQTWGKVAAQAQRVEVSGISGTIWSGEAMQVKAQGESLGRLSWQFQPSRLFTGNLEYQFRLGQGSAIKLDAKGYAGAGLAGMYAKQLLVSLPIEQVMARMPQKLPVEVSGRIEMSLKEFSYAQPWCESATGTLAWTGAGINSPLGPLTPQQVIADIQCKKNNVSLTADQNNSETTSHAQVTLDPKTGYQLQAWFKPGAEFPEQMAKQLRWLGEPNAQGQYPFTLAGKL